MDLSDDDLSEVFLQALIGSSSADFVAFHFLPEQIPPEVIVAPVLYDPLDNPLLFLPAVGHPVGLELVAQPPHSTEVGFINYLFLEVSTSLNIYIYIYNKHVSSRHEDIQYWYLAKGVLVLT